MRTEITHNLKCPDCDSRDTIAIRADCWIKIGDDLSETDQFSDDLPSNEFEWNEHNGAMCVACGHEGNVSKFTINPRDDYEIRPCIEIEGNVTSYVNESEFNAAVLKLAGVKLFNRYWSIYRLEDGFFMAYGHPLARKEQAEEILTSIVENETFFEIGVYPLVCDEDGNSRLIEKRDEKPDCWDVEVVQRLEHSHEIVFQIEDHECTNEKDVTALVKSLEAKYPDANLDWAYA